MTPRPFALAALALLAVAPRPVSARQEAPKPKGDAPRAFASRAELNAHFDAEFLQVDRRRISDLAALAAKLTGPEADLTYQDVFNLAVARDQYDAAEPAAETYLSGTKGDPRTRALASFVEIIAASNRGEYDVATERLGRFLKASAVTAAPKPGSEGAPQALDPATFYAVGEAFVQRLIRAGRYDVARKVCSMFAGGPLDASVKSHFEGRLGRIERLGKPAPKLEAKDIDGNPVSLDALKGKVVLVDFWATWAPPCLAEIPHYNALAAQYKGKDFAIIGVDLDAMRTGISAADTTKIYGQLREFLVNQRVAFPVVMDAPGKSSLVEAYGVTDIPANFLIGRDGKVQHVELTGPELDKAIAEALGGETRPGKINAPVSAKGATPAKP